MKAPAGQTGRGCSRVATAKVIRSKAFTLNVIKSRPTITTHSLATFLLLGPPSAGVDATERVVASALEERRNDVPSVLPPGARGREPVIVCGSAAMREVCAAAARVAAGDAKVFISGESGVGKDLIAQYIHARSRRAPRPYIAVNCAAFSETLLESELFGHARGSFTGAYRDRPGCLEQAHRGTIFLDEVGEMSLRMQADLLRFLEDGEVQRVGDTGPRPTCRCEGHCRDQPRSGRARDERALS